MRSGCESTTIQSGVVIHDHPVFTVREPTCLDEKDRWAGIALNWMRELGFRWRSLRYGDELVPVRQASKIFVRVVSPELVERSFSEQRSMLVRTIDQDIVQAVALQQLRGSYCLKWGVSLSFVPHRWNTEIAWHRTAKSVHLDLFEAPAIASELPLREFDRITASGINGGDYFERDLRRLWRLQRTEVLGWLDELTTVQAVLEKAREQQRVGSNWHSPHPGLVEAFTLGRSGNREEAVVALERAIAFDRPGLEPVEGLRSALEQVIVGDH